MLSKANRLLTSFIFRVVYRYERGSVLSSDTVCIFATDALQSDGIRSNKPSTESGLFNETASVTIKESNMWILHLNMSWMQNVRFVSAL